MRVCVIHNFLRQDYTEAVLTPFMTNQPLALFISPGIVYTYGFILVNLYHHYCLVK